MCRHKQQLQDCTDITTNTRLNHKCRPEIPEPMPSLSQHGVPIGGVQGFFQDQNNRDLSGAYVLRSER